MQTKISIKQIFSAMVIAAIFLVAPSCDLEDTEASVVAPNEPIEKVAVGSSILEERTAFWQEWKDNCFPNNDWNTTTFITNGQDFNQFKTDMPEVWQAMANMYTNPADADKYLPEVIRSGSTYPIKVTAYIGQKLYKIVPQGRDIAGPSPYYVTDTQLQSIKLHPEELEQKLGLPLSSVSGEYWIYSITSVADDNLFFQSSIAATGQNANATPELIYRTPGEAVQSLLINNNDPLKWKKSITPDEKYIPNTLPKVE